MSTLEIRKFNDPVLRKKAEKVQGLEEGIKKLIDDMGETMLKNDGIGLAANQVGVLKRVIVLNSDALKLQLSGLPSEALAKEGFFALINPKITSISLTREIGEEGCLSFPNIFIKIERSNEVRVEGLDKDGRKIEIVAKNLFARVLQHEIDHLDGILFFDRLPLSKRIFFKIRLLSKSWRL